MSWFFKEKSDQKFQPLELSITTLFIHAARLDDNYSEIEKKNYSPVFAKIRDC